MRPISARSAAGSRCSTNDAISNLTILSGTRRLSRRAYRVYGGGLWALWALYTVLAGFCRYRRPYAMHVTNPPRAETSTQPMHLCHQNRARNGWSSRLPARVGPRRPYIKPIRTNRARFISPTTVRSDNTLVLHNSYRCRVTWPDRLPRQPAVYPAAGLSSKHLACLAWEGPVPRSGSGAIKEARCLLDRQRVQTYISF